MNLAEFPITLLTDRVPAGQRTLYYEDHHGKLVITGSDAYGLPTAGDADVIVALIQLTKSRNNFDDATVNFTRYELLKLLGWPDIGRSYRRLSESLYRWSTVSLHYQGTWWDNRKKKNVNVIMHIIETLILFDRPQGTEQPPLPLSSFTWNRHFFESCRADNLKRLDLGVYFALQHPSSKRLYRFLDKRFHGTQGNLSQTFDLEEIAFARVGLSQGYAGNAGKIKEKLRPAIEELESIGFLEPEAWPERFQKQDRAWTVQFRRNVISPAPSLPEPPPPAVAEEPPSIVAELVRRGVTRKTAMSLGDKHQAEQIAAKLDVFDWLMEKQDKRVEKSPAGYLVRSIQDDFATPKGFVPPAERLRRQEPRRRRPARRPRQTARSESRPPRPARKTPPPMPAGGR